MVEMQLFAVFPSLLSSISVTVLMEEGRRMISPPSYCSFLICMTIDLHWPEGTIGLSEILQIPTFLPVAIHRIIFMSPDHLHMCKFIHSCSIAMSPGTHYSISYLPCCSIVEVLDPTDSAVPLASVLVPYGLKKEESLLSITEELV